MAEARLPERMSAWRKYHDNITPVWEEIPVPSIPAEGYLVRIIAAGVCHSDYTLVNMTTKRPGFADVYTLGHEGCGVVVGIGEQVQNPITIGTKVAVFAVPGCAKPSCGECSRGFPQICLTGEHYGLGQDGSFAEYTAAHARAVVPLPDGVSPSHGAVATDAVLTAYHAIVRRARITPNNIVLQFGLGGLGFNGLQILLALGVRVIVSDIKADVLQAAAEQGVPPEDIIPVGKSATEFVRENGLEGRVDVVLDFVGVQGTFGDAQVIVRRGGTIVGIGLLASELKIDLGLCLRKMVSVLFNYGGQREDLEEVLQMISKGQIKPFVKMARMKDFPKVLEKLHAGEISGRVVLAPEGVEFDGQTELLEI